MNLFEKRPFAVGKRDLHLMAGLMWSGVGIMLGSYAYHWLKSLPSLPLLLLTLTGFLLASLIYIFGFSKLAQKNIHRIRRLSGKRHSIFSFQKWTSYPLVVVMVSLGIYLRKYSPLPKPVLGATYIGIGGGLFSSSMHYFTYLWKEYRPTRKDRILDD
ncbi:MAG: hypothetical protein R6U57_04670 [Anaerolineales bacterium]